MRSLLFCSLFFFSHALMAGSFLSTQVHDFDYGSDSTEKTLVFLSSGQIASVPNEDEEILSQLAQAQMDKTWLNIILNNENEIISLEKTTDPELMYSVGELSIDENKSLFTPTVISSMDLAKQYFREQKDTTKSETQCYNRAMVWSYEMKRDHDVNSMKMFIYFTRRFIRKYEPTGFKWWFHVAPYVHVIEDGKVVEKVMDKKFSSGPVSVERWSKTFLRREAFDCPVITKYSDYADYAWTGNCMLMRSNMFYYQPLDFETEELYGQLKTNWVDWEVKSAYLEAFDITL